MTPEKISTLDLYEGIKSLLAKEKKSATPYGVAKFLGANPKTGYTWRDNEHTMDEPFAINAALALGLDPDFVLACLAAERAGRLNRPESAEAWERIARRLATAASICAVWIFLSVEMTKPVL